MQKHETLSYEEQYRDQSVNFSPHAVWQTGLQTAQSVLKLDAYSLASVPYRFGMQKAVLICALSVNEMLSFQRFKNTLAGLSLSFQRPDEKNPIKVFCRCQIEEIGKMKDREQFALIVCAWKPIPPDLARILGEYFLCVEGLRLQYSDYKGKILSISPDTAKKLGYNNYATLASGGDVHKLALFTIGVSKLDFLLPMSSPDLVPGSPGLFSLFFQRYRFAVKGKIETALRLPTGVQKASASLEFSAELVQLFEEYYSAERKAPS